MISLESLLNMICTEAIEYGGLQEIPERTDGIRENFSVQKHYAREHIDTIDTRENVKLPTMVFPYVIRRGQDGELDWVDIRQK